jgi:excisionase family DNA binding protein
MLSPSRSRPIDRDEERSHGKLRERCNKVSSTHMSKDVLTTSQAAELLGISVRTAQLLIEGGALTSWKTPGGHRRVYRDDVLALIAKAKTTPVPLPARGVVLASEQRASAYRSILSTVNEYAFDIHTNAPMALFALGHSLPTVLIVDMAERTPLERSQLDDILRHPALGHLRVIEVAATDGPLIGHHAPRDHIRVGSPEQLPVVLHALLGDAAQPISLGGSASFPLAANEGQRLAALERSGLVDTQPEEPFDRLIWLACHALGSPIALMTVLTPTRQWFKARRGLDLTETPRSWAFCNYTLLQRDVLIVEDLARDERFTGNPAVEGAPHLRFYAGAPVLDPDGFGVGSICILDFKPRGLDEDGRKILRALAAIASDQLRLRAVDRELRGAMDAINRGQYH